MASLDDLLARTSRTFALAIPRLPEPTRHHVTVAYLLFRIADTFEDAARWPKEERKRALAEFRSMLVRPGALTERDLATVTRWLEARPCDNEDYLELVAETPAVLQALSTMAPAARAIVTLHANRTAEGMAHIVDLGSEDGSLELHTVQELRDYCYIVAGIVGELLTELFLADAPSLAPARELLDRYAVAFGEGLQLVNILKDQSEDALEGRRYVPSGVPHAELFALARRDLDDARTYVTALQAANAPLGYVAFCALPVLLAREALRVVEQSGPGAKVPRETVVALLGGLDNALASRTPAIEL